MKDYIQPFLYGISALGIGSVLFGLSCAVKSLCRKILKQEEARGNR